MNTCGNCAIKENAPEMVRRVMGAIHYCPVHGVYVRPDEAACEHGTKVCLCLEPNWVGVVVEVSRRIGQPTMYKVEWRDGRGFASRWFSREEIDAFAVALQEV